MAKKSSTPSQPAAPSGPDHLVLEARTCFSDGEGADSTNRSDMADDLKFVYEPGYQWDTVAKQKRQGRPNYTFNRVMGAVNQAIGEQRQVRPSGKVRAASRDAAAPTAEVFGGMVRNIEAVSRADNIYDNQFKYAVAGAYGAWVVRPYYCDDTSFDQEILIEEVPNPFTAMWDNNATDPCKRDARWGILANRISLDQYKEDFPDFSPSSFNANRDSRGWLTNKDVRIAEFFKKIIRRSTIAELDDGRVVPYDPATKRVLKELEGYAGGDRQGPKVERTRVVNNMRVVWCKVDGANILEGPIEYKWRYIPLVRLPGRYVNIEGKQLLQSLIRHSKDPQRVYNYHRSTMVETAALTPRAPYLVTPKMIKGHEEEWRTLNSVNRPYLKYDIDTAAVATGGKPSREPPPEVPQALIMLAAQDAEDIRQTTGQVGPSSDQQDPSQPESGISRRYRMLSGESGAYEFLDNLGKAIQLTWDICIDMIPTVIDTQRLVRTIGVDGIESFVEVNQKELDPNDPEAIMHALDKGKYEVTVTLGPTYATQRLEALDTLLEAADKVPIIGEVAADLIAKNLDTKDGEELHKRVRQAMIQAGKIQPTERDQKDMPPAPPPDPVQTALANRLVAQANKDQASAAQTQAETMLSVIKAHGAPLELQKLIDELVGQRLENMLAAQQLGIGPGGVLTMQRTVEHQSGVPAMG